ncbi:sulfite exporter TauE/SafE family protein [Candidatus Albibeggiatoa sp. nov. NOAA]|uniref:sulfite exporter TauE/SafE family protein n=1 Tax=Candidatus Albibeggiatoa sp. nov. NOAA TaxID=3162724 RepID=UPI0032FD774E|nr:sulfite exporter TauE/SafE family protein [Thiotrichaceae bacterium]
MELIHILAGLGVGVIVGLTGVGGGAVMTPILILGFGIHPSIAVGTDLLYAALSKASAAWIHSRYNNVDWTVVGFLALGSVPMSIITGLLLQFIHVQGADYNEFITSMIGLMLVVTAFLMIFKQRIVESKLFGERGLSPSARYFITFCAGMLLGVVVTLSSIGAGAIGAAVLSLLYPEWKTSRIVGTDLVHAVPLAAVAGLGHWQFLGSVDFMLLGGLLIGAYPGIVIGSLLNFRLPEHLLRNTLAVMLFFIGLRFAF